MRVYRVVIYRNKGGAFRKGRAEASFKNVVAHVPFDETARELLRSAGRFREAGFCPRPAATLNIPPGHRRVQSQRHRYRALTLPQ